MSSGRREALVYGGLALLALIVLVPNAPAGRVLSEDTGVFTYVARLIGDGGLPYRDAWDHKPPGVYLIDAVALAVAGLWGLWAAEVVALALAAILSYRAFANTGLGGAAALAGTFAWLVALPRLFLEDAVQTNFSELFALPLQLAALDLFAREEARPRPTWRTAAIGTLGGSALLLKPTVGAIWIAIALTLVVTRVRARRYVDLGWRVVFLAVPAAIPVALVAGWLAAGGAIAAAADQVVRYNAAYTAFATATDRLDAIAQGLRLLLPSGLALVALAGWILALRAPRPPLLTIAVVALPLELALASAGRGYHYYFIAWLPALGALAAYAASRLERRLDPAAAPRVLIAAGVVMAILPGVVVARLALERDDGIAREAAVYVGANTRPGETVLVWGSRSEVLVLAERRSATRFVYQYAALATRGYSTAAEVAALLDDLERSRPVLVVDASRDSFVTPPLDRAALATWSSPEPQYRWPRETARVVAWLESGYDRVATLGGGWPVWRRRAP